MKLSEYLVVLVLLFLLIPAGMAAPNTTYERLISPDDGNYLEVSHVIIRGGTNEEIGYEIGRIGREDLDSILVPFDEPIYGKAKEEYIKETDPVLFERMKGIGKAYNLSDDDYNFDTSFPLYILRFPLCSAIYFPPSSTENGHAIAGRNMDWSYNPETGDFIDIEGEDVDELLTDTSGSIEQFIADKMGTMCDVIEIYPDDGYATLVIGTSDLLNGVVDGINEKGLAVASLQDGDTYNDPLTSLAGGKSTGLNGLQVLRTILEHCADVDEAKERLLTSKISMPYMGQHFLIYDESGNATIAEFDNTSREVIFTDYEDTPVVLTNYAVHLNPDVSKLSPTNPDDPHDDYLRSIKLHNYIDTHDGKFNATDAWVSMAEVQAASDGISEGVLTGGVRLLWTVVTDLTDKTMTVKFFLKDGPITDNKTRTHELNLSEPYTFKLER